MNRLQHANNRDQIVLYSQTIAESLKKGHEVFAFAKLVDGIDVSKFLAQYSREGGKAYDPRLMLALLIYGYHRGWRSSRELQRACEENSAMRYLVGDQKVKFRVKFGDEISDVFKQSVGQVAERHSTTGADVKVDDSAEVEKRISDFVTQQKSQAKARLAKKPVASGPDGKKENPAKPVDPNQQQIFTAALKLGKINAALKKTTGGNDASDKINLTDADARFMKNRGKITQSYNVQVASSEGFILAADIAMGNAENDQRELPAILDQVQSNTGRRIATTTEDAVTP